MANAYKFENDFEGAVDKLFQKGLVNESGGSFLQTLIDERLETEANRYFWQEHFTVEGQEYQINPSNLRQDPAYTVKSISRRVVPMADASAPLSESAQLDNEGFESRTGSIFRFSKGLYETSLSKKELEARLLEYSPADRNLVTGFAMGIADLIKTHNYRLSNMAAQVISKGGAYDNVNSKGWSGVRISAPAYVPAENFVKAGTALWADSACDIPSQMQKIEQDFKKARNLPEDAPFEWDLSYDMVMNVFLNNSFVKAEVNRYIRLYAPDKVIVITSGASNIDTTVVSWEQLISYTRSSVSKIAPIRIVKESQTVQTISTTTTVNGWKTGVAVLRPLGNAGVIVHSNIEDVMLMQSGEVNKTVDFSIARYQNFLYVINKVVPNGIWKAYHTDVLGRYAPVLNEFTDHCVVDTLTAD